MKYLILLISLLTTLGANAYVVPYQDTVYNVDITSTGQGDLFVRMMNIQTGGTTQRFIGGSGAFYDGDFLDQQTGDVFQLNIDLRNPEPNLNITPLGNIYN